MAKNKTKNKRHPHSKDNNALRSFLKARVLSPCSLDHRRLGRRRSLQSRPLSPAASGGAFPAASPGDIALPSSPLPSLSRRLGRGAGGQRSRPQRPAAEPSLGAAAGGGEQEQPPGRAWEAALPSPDSLVRDATPGRPPSGTARRRAGGPRWACSAARPAHGGAQPAPSVARGGTRPAPSGVRGDARPAPGVRAACPQRRANRAAAGLHRAATAHAHIDIVRGGNSSGATRQLGGELTCSAVLVIGCCYFVNALV